MPPEPLAEKPATSPTPSSPPSPRTSLKQIRTFQGDVAEALSSQKESLVSIARQEKLRQSQGYTIAEKPEANGLGKSLVFMLGTLLFLALAGLGGWYTYAEFVRKTAVPVVAVPQSRLLTPESTREVSLAETSRETLFNDIAAAGAETKPAELRHIIVRDVAGNEATIEAFLAKLNAQAPGSLIRAFEPIFMLGSLGESRFLIIKLASFQNAFAGMLSWEATMAGDMAGLFASAPELQQIAGSGVFTDVAYRNKDLRVLMVNESPALLYSFYNNDTLIITDKPETLQTLIDRLTQESLAR